MRKLLFLTFVTSCILALPILAHADCSASQNCGFCNAGQFTVQCQCKDSQGYVCTNCSPPNPCSSGVGCCCALVGTPPNQRTACASFSCYGGGTCTTQVNRPSNDLIASNSQDSVAAALQSIDSGPKILDLEPEIEIANDPSWGVEISNVVLNISSEKISGATYTIRNVSGKPLIAFQANIDFYWDQGGKPCTGGNTEDSWFLNQSILQPGEAEEVHFNKTIIPNKPTHLHHIVVSLEYANFSDGSITGRKPEAVAQVLNRNRHEKLVLQQEYAQAIRSGLTNDEISKKLQDDMTKGIQNPARRTALIQLNSVLKDLGPEAFASKIAEPPTLQLK